MIGAALSLLVITGAKAQVLVKEKVDNEVTHRMFHWGIEGGVDVNYLNHLQGGETSNTRVGGFGGFLVDIGGGHFTFQPGLRYIYKGGETNNVYQDAFVRIETNNKLGFNYIEMPLNFVWHSGGRADGFMIGGGGYVAYAVSAHDNFTITTQSMLEGAPPATVISGSRKIELGNVDNGAERRWDAGLGAFIGYQFPIGVFLKAGMEWGFVNMRKNVITGEESARNQNGLFTLGYMFGHNKCKD